MSSSWLSSVSYAANVITIPDAVTITVIPQYEVASPGGSVEVLVVVHNPATEGKFVATSCLLWYNSPQGWILVSPEINSAYCLPRSSFPIFFPPGQTDVWGISQSVAPTLRPITLEWKLLAVGWEDSGHGAVFPAISQWAYFTVRIT
jgi:hypothetical protein